MSDHNDGEAVGEEPNPLQRMLDLLVFAPVGLAVTVAEDLPGLIDKGRHRFETDVNNARVVGQFVVTHGQREVVERLGKLFHRDTTDTTGATDTAPVPSADAAASTSNASNAAETALSPDPKPAVDPADGVIVEAALAGYDTLSASQVVRRLESLGPDDLRAIQRYEASRRNRRTILNRAGQILEAVGGTGGAPESDLPDA